MTEGDEVKKKFGNFGFVDVLKALTLLDSKRERLSLEKKLARIQTNNAKHAAGRVMKTQKLGVYKNRLDSLGKIEAELAQGARGLTGALAKRVREWVRGFTPQELEYFALNLPTEPWKKLANLVHLHPEKDLSAAWFLPYCFGVEPPPSSKVAKCKNMCAENVNELVSEFEDLPYSLLKKYKSSLTNASKEKIARRQEKIDTLIWYYEDLRCPSVDNIIRVNF